MLILTVSEHPCWLESDGLLCNNHVLSCFYGFSLPSVPTLTFQKQSLLLVYFLPPSHSFCGFFVAPPPFYFGLDTQRAMFPRACLLSISTTYTTGGSIPFPEFKWYVILCLTSITSCWLNLFSPLGWLRGVSYFTENPDSFPKLSSSREMVVLSSLIRPQSWCPPWFFHAHSTPDPVWKSCWFSFQNTPGSDLITSPHPHIPLLRPAFPPTPIPHHLPCTCRRLSTPKPPGISEKSQVTLLRMLHRLPLSPRVKTNVLTVACKVLCALNLSALLMAAAVSSPLLLPGPWPLCLGLFAIYLLFLSI